MRHGVGAEEQVRGAPAKEAPAGTRRQSPWPDSPPWSPATRLWVVTTVVVTLAAIWWSVRQFTTIVVLATLLAYVLNPLIARGQARLGLRRGLATIAVYSTVAIALILVSIGLAQSVAQSLSSATRHLSVERSGLALQRLLNALEDTVAALPPEITLLGQRVPLQPHYQRWEQELFSGVQTLTAALLDPDSVARMLGFATGFATGFVFTAFGLMVTFFVSLYLAMDGDNVLRWVEEKVPTAYRPAYNALRHEIDAVWRRFFRGQLILAVSVGLLTTLGLTIIGIPYALPLGVVAGVLEVVPRLGPALSVVPAAAVALLLPSTAFPDLPRMWLVLLVALLYIAVQQIENNILVPRILGGSVRLPPAVVLVGALAGAKVAGVPGILLAAPVMGSLRVLGSWIYDQLTRPDTTPSPVIEVPPVRTAVEPPTPAGKAPADAERGPDTMPDTTNAPPERR